jgi:carbonic anhydrase
MGKYSEFETRRQPWFDESNFNGFNFAIPMKTMVIYCLDPRASDIPQAVAGHFGDEVYAGESFSTKPETALVPRGHYSP